MKLDILSALNAERAARRAAVVVTDVASGEQRLVPRTAFVVVYLDGEYHGLFTVIDRVDDEFIEEMGFDATGNLYKSVDHDANFALTNADGQPKLTLHDGWEKEEGEPTLATHGGCCPGCGYEMSAYQWSNHASCPKCSAPTAAHPHQEAKSND